MCDLSSTLATLCYFGKCVNFMCYLFQLDQLFNASSDTVDNDVNDAGTVVS